MLKSVGFAVVGFTIAVVATVICANERARGYEHGYEDGFSEAIKVSKE